MYVCMHVFMYARVYRSDVCIHTHMRARVHVCSCLCVSSYQQQRQSCCARDRDFRSNEAREVRHCASAWATTVGARVCAHSLWYQQVDLATVGVACGHVSVHEVEFVTYEGAHEQGGQIHSSVRSLFGVPAH